jgi:hypothetical protein
MSTEFNDGQHYGFFMTGTKLTSDTGKYLRQSELTLAALRAAGFLDNMVDGTAPPSDLSMLWLDKNSDPAVLKEWNPVGAAWEQVTNETLFGRVPWRGEWSSSAIYRRGDVVTYQSTIWIAAQTSQNQAPAENDYWDLFLDSLADDSITPEKMADDFIIQTVATRTALKEVDTTRVTSVYLKEAGRAGVFKWTLGDFSTHIGTDTAEGIYIKANAIAATSGAWIRQYDGEVHVEWFGAIAGLQKSNAPTNDTAFAGADSFMHALGGGTVHMCGQFYCLTRVRWSPGVYFEGAGFGRWMPSLRTISKTWEGTNLIACGTGARDYTVQGITSMKYAGGWVTHPDSAGYTMKLNSFMKEDASGTSPATLREMSVFAANKDINSDGGGIRRCRIVPWIGADGINSYSDDTNEDLGDDWDAGLMLDTAVACRLEDVQVRGYWRMIGFAWVERGYELFGRSEGNVIRNVSAQGLTGLAVRAGDIWRVLANTSNTLTIRWSEESYWPTSGSFEGGSGTDYAYSSLTRSGDNLIFNGVSPAITSESQIRNINRGWGFSTSIMENVECWGWRHHSGKTPSQLGLDGSTAKGCEFSGFPLRGLHGFNFTSYGPADAGDGVTYLTPNCMQMHDVDDLVLIGGKLETGFVIGSPSRSSSTAVAGEGATLNLRMLETYFTASTDKRLLKFQGGNITQLQQNPPSLNSAHLVRMGMDGQDIYDYLPSGRSYQIRNAAGTALVTVFEGSGNVDYSGTVLRPSVDLGTAIGAQTRRFNSAWVQSIRPGAGAAIWTSGTGSPEGVVSAAVGSLYTRTDGGASTTLYVKESGSGNTGWVVK